MPLHFFFFSKMECVWLALGFSRHLESTHSVLNSADCTSNVFFHIVDTVSLVFECIGIFFFFIVTHSQITQWHVSPHSPSSMAWAPAPMVWNSGTYCTVQLACSQIRLHWWIEASVLPELGFGLSSGLTQGSRHLTHSPRTGTWVETSMPFLV